MGVLSGYAECGAGTDMLAAGGGWVRFSHDLILLIQSLVVRSCTHEGMSAGGRSAIITGVCRG